MTIPQQIEDSDLVVLLVTRKLWVLVKGEFLWLMKTLETLEVFIISSGFKIIPLRKEDSFLILKTL